MMIKVNLMNLINKIRKKIINYKINNKRVKRNKNKMIKLKKKTINLTHNNFS